MTDGLAAHAHAHLTAAPALDMHDKGGVLESYPLVRRTYECALRAQRMSLTKGAESIGVPAIVVVGKGFVDGVVEVKDRATGERSDVPLADLVHAVSAKEAQ